MVEAALEVACKRNREQRAVDCSISRPRTVAAPEVAWAGEK
jgi:hypothetical protein